MFFVKVFIIFTNSINIICEAKSIQALLQGKPTETLSLQSQFITNTLELMHYIMSIKFLMQVKEFAKEYKTEIKDIKEIFYINEMFKQIGNKLYLIWHYDNTTLHTLHNKTWNVIEIIFKDNISRHLKNKIILHLHKTCKTNNWQLVVDKHSSSNLYYKCKFIYTPNYKMNSEDHTALLQSKFVESTNILRSYFNGSKLLLKIKQLAKNLNIKVDNIKDIIDFDNLATRIAKRIYCIKYYY